MLNRGTRRGGLLPLLAAGTVLGAAFAAQAVNTEKPTAVVLDGKAAALVVLPDSPSAVARYAAQELVYHVKKATGVELPVVPESAAPADGKSRIYLGACRAARPLLARAGRLAPEAFLLQTEGSALFIAGEDGGGDPLDPDTRAGTLFGVYEWLERDLNAAWLWPGELGTSVPKRRAIVAQKVQAVLAPRFFQRRLRPGLGMKGENAALGFTARAAEQYERDQAVFLRRHRMGRSQRMSYGHAFTQWWEKYGARHPEWFQLLPSGKRGPAKPTARFSMCVSNPEFQREVVAQWKAAGGGKATGNPSYLNAVENDILGLCTCEPCRAWDGPEPKDYLKYYSAKSKVAGSRFVSDRYARFWLAVQQLAAKEDPDAVVIGYVYFNYFQAPTSGVKLNPNILLGYCPSGNWYPRAADEHAWMKAQWRGWRDTGARLFSRTNYFLDGYCMPFIFAHQFADDFQHAAQNGMVATDFDSLTGQWSTQGPNLYLLARLHVRPDRPADELLNEYYSAFGPAAANVRSYFDYWERYTMENRARINQVFDDLEASRWRTWAKAAHAAFPPACFPPAEALLAKAAEAARPDPEAAARVRFLQLGLEHARLCTRAASLLSLADPASTPERGKAALNALLAFRRAHEKDGIANFNQLAWVEDLSWKLSNETRQAPELYP